MLMRHEFIVLLIGARLISSSFEIKEGYSADIKWISMGTVGQWTLRTSFIIVIIINKHVMAQLLLTVKRLHHTDSHRISRMRLPTGRRRIMSDLLCACSLGGFLQ